MTQLITQFGDLFAKNIPLIDTRAPVEYQRGSLPNAVNLPLMDDAEREAVGRCYKQQGPDAAMALGHELVSGEIRSSRIAAWQAFAQAHPQGALFCFRGGLRSQLVQEWLAEAGIHYPRIAGGYKAMRQWLTASTEGICDTRQFVVVAGKTGCAKTRLITQGATGQGIPGMVDLEGLANHRGSSFGRRVGGQPSQISFEMSLDVALYRTALEPLPYIVLEDESRLIGRCALPLVLQACIKAAPLVIVEATLEQRVQHSFENYILANLEELRIREPTDEQAFNLFAEDLRNAMARIAKRLGGERYQQLSTRLEAAIRCHQSGDPSQHLGWIETLLRDYYDPMYNYQLKGRQSQVLFSGSEASVTAFLLDQQRGPRV